MLVALYSSRLLGIVHIARNSMIEKMPDGVLVLDALDHVVDFNFTAQNVFAIHPQQLGNNIETVIPHWPELIAFAKTPSQDVLQTIIRDQANAAIFDTRKTLLIDDRKQLYGKLIILRNITKQFQIEQQLNERVKQLRCIYDLALLSEAPENSLGDILQASVKLISDAMSFPEIACARLIFEGQTFAAENYQEPASIITNKIILGGDEVGVLETGFLDGPDSQETSIFLMRKEICWTSWQRGWVKSSTCSARRIC